MDVDHVAACPDISPLDCAEADADFNPIPVHMHHQSIRWFRSTLAGSFGLGEGWQLQATLPVDVKILTIDYSRDGEAYSPPYAGIHHRNETLFGFSDGTVQIQKYQSLGSSFSLGLGVGTGLPFGRTEPDPFFLGSLSEEHQHFQRGTGTFVPQANLSVFWHGSRWRAMMWSDGRLPLYENDYGYRPGTHLSLGLMSGYRLTPKSQLLATTQLQRDGAASWSGDASNTPGRDLMMGGLGGIYNLDASWSIQGQFRSTLWQQTRGTYAEDQLLQRFLITLGLSWSPARD